MNNKIPQPYSCQIEICEGCTRRCKYCGIQSTGWSRDYFKFMTTDLAKTIAIDLNSWFGGKGKRLEFALQGEPLANPNISEIIKIFRDNYTKSQLQITTNGDLIKLEVVEELFKNGLNMLLIDCYDKNAKSRIQEILLPITSAFKSQPVSIPSFDFYKDKPKVWSYKGNTQKEIIYMDSIMDVDNPNKTITRTLNNQAAFGKFQSGVKLPLKMSCSNPFRELVVKHNGTVYSCCMSGWIPNPEMIVGKFPDESLKEIWEGEKFNNIRKILYNSERYKLNTCAKCDYKGYKNGLAKHDFKDIFETDPILPQKSRSLFE